MAPRWSGCTADTGQFGSFGKCAAGIISFAKPPEEFTAFHKESRVPLSIPRPDFAKISELLKVAAASADQYLSTVTERRVSPSAEAIGELSRFHERLPETKT